MCLDAFPPLPGTFDCSPTAAATRPLSGRFLGKSIRPGLHPRSVTDTDYTLVILRYGDEPNPILQYLRGFDPQPPQRSRRLCQAHHDGALHSTMILDRYGQRVGFAHHFGNAYPTYPW